MTDIVERLRFHPADEDEVYALFNEAADEIEKARIGLKEQQAEIEQLRKESDRARTPVGWPISATIEKMQEWRQADHEDAVCIHRNHAISVLDEIVRLRKDVQNLNRDCMMLAGEKHGPIRDERHDRGADADSQRAPGDHPAVA